jgi:hypothetical protein
MKYEGEFNNGRVSTGSHVWLLFGFVSIIHCHSLSQFQVEGSGKVTFADGSDGTPKHEGEFTPPWGSASKAFRV